MKFIKRTLLLSLLLVTGLGLGASGRAAEVIFGDSLVSMTGLTWTSKCGVQGAVSGNDFVAVFKKNPKMVKAWERVHHRPHYRADIKFLDKLSELYSPILINKFPGGQGYLDELIEAFVHPHTGTSHSFMKNIADHVDDIKFFANNYNKVPGYEKVLVALKNKNFYAQDGASFMLSKLKAIDPKIVKRLEGKIIDADNLDNIDDLCTNCSFDIEIEIVPGQIKKIELKSYISETIDKISTNSKFKRQLTAYLVEVNSINDFEYIFNGIKISDNLTPIKENFKLLFQKSNYSIYDEIVSSRPTSNVFTSLGINNKGQFIQAVNTLDPELYNFIKIFK